MIGTYHVHRAVRARPRDFVEGQLRGGMLQIEPHMARRLAREIAISVHMLRLQEVGRTVGPGAEIGAPRLAQALLEDARDFPVLRMNVANSRIAEMSHILHHEVNGSIV